MKKLEEKTLQNLVNIIDDAVFVVESFDKDDVFYKTYDSFYFEKQVQDDLRVCIHRELRSPWSKSNGGLETDEKMYHCVELDSDKEDVIEDIVLDEKNADEKILIDAIEKRIATPDGVKRLTIEETKKKHADDRREYKEEQKEKFITLAKKHSI